MSVLQSHDIDLTEEDFRPSHEARPLPPTTKAAPPVAEEPFVHHVLLSLPTRVLLGATLVFFALLLLRILIVRCQRRSKKHN